MIRRTALNAIIAIGFLLALSLGALAQNDVKPAIQRLPFVSPIFGDNMVLQRGKVNTISGWSDPGDKVQIDIAGNHAFGVAGADGHWQLKIQPPPAGGPYTLAIKGHQTVELRNVLVGDVWLCGGQSNMQVSLRSVRNAEEEIKAASYPEIRFFTVAAHPAYHHTDAPQGSWKVVSPETADRVSAVAYTLHSRCSEKFTFPSVWSWMPWAELPQRPGRVPPRCARSRTLMSLWRNWKNWPQPGRAGIRKLRHALVCPV